MSDSPAPIKQCRYKHSGLRVHFEVKDYGTCYPAHRPPCCLCNAPYPAVLREDRQPVQLQCLKTSLQAIIKYKYCSETNEHLVVVPEACADSATGDLDAATENNAEQGFPVVLHRQIDSQSI